MLLRAAREMLNLPPLSEAAESVYFDALVPQEDDYIVAAIRYWLRNEPGIPTPHDLRVVISAKPVIGHIPTQEVSHG